MKKHSYDVEMAKHNLNEHRIMLKHTLGKVVRQFKRAYNSEGISGVLFCLFA